MTGAMTATHRRGRRSNYDKSPVVDSGRAGAGATGWAEVASRLRAGDPRVVVVDCYPGVLDSDIKQLSAALAPDVVVDTGTALKPPAAIDAMVRPELGDDPVFGRLTTLRLIDFFDQDRLVQLRRRVDDAVGRVLVVGVGAALFGRGDVLVHASMPRREIELRHHRGEIGNLGADNVGTRPSLLYKRAYFVDWRVADAHKQSDVWPHVDFVLDTTGPNSPALVGATDYFDALAGAVSRPFRVVPWFEPAPWGGRWMQQVCDLDPDVDNFGWCFDCVPEENSLLLGFGSQVFETPSLDLVMRHPQELLGPSVVRRFGAEFPIRFDFLDTMGGGNLSLQVHPLTDYIREHFGLRLTQDESYYLLDADDDAVVYLGVRGDADPEAMAAELCAAQDGGPAFAAERYVNVWPAQPHDHFLIPAGTVHCSGRNSMVLEVSATPYIFTFKLWDWGRLGLDGRPRPVHLEHGLRNIQWQRNTEFVRRELVNDVEPIGSGDGWRAERTGLHEAEFIDTERHWFTGAVVHDTADAVNVLNLVSGEEAVVASPDGAFPPFTVHYAETFIVPAAVGLYSVTPSGAAAGTECATLKAFVRP
jgi:mannose-6-phosphate isomerase class I